MLGGIVESNRPAEAQFRFVRHPQRLQVKSQDVVAPRLIWHDGQRPAHQFDCLSGLAGLMSDYPEQVQGIDVIGRGLQNLLVKPAGLLQTPGAMVIHRLLQQLIYAPRMFC